MKRETRNVWLFLAAVVLLASVLPSVVAAKGAADVANGLHNLSAAGQDPMNYYSQSPYRTNESEVCVFCHTPHGGSLTGPLWNHDLPANNFTHYTSATLGTYLSGLSNTRPISDESLLCMSCHDGSVSTNHVINLPNTRNGVEIRDWANDPNTEIDLAFIVGARIGGSPGGNESGSGDLTDDHPISFSYDSVRAQPEYVGGSKMGQLRDVQTASTYDAGEGVRFFNTASVTPGSNRVECSTCHDPHVFYDIDNPEYAPFLIMPNTGSNLCLACHNK